MSQSLKTISKRTGLSVATVSRALGGSTHVREATREKVRRAAVEIGYTRPPLVGAIMSSLRRSAQHIYLGNLALISLAGPAQKRPLPFHLDMIEGAKARAATLGFKLDAFTHTPSDNRHASLNRVLRNRGITGIIVISESGGADFSRFDWSHFAAVQCDNAIVAPLLHNTGIDHHRTLHTALTRLVERGYARLGLFIETYKDMRLAYKWSGAFAAFQRNMPRLGKIPELEQRMLERDSFLKWFHKHKPDIVIGHKTSAIEWLRGDGVRVPEDAGFFNLNLNESPVPCAGLDLEARLQGAVAVEAVVTQIHQFDRGVPAHPKTIYVEGRFVGGPTIKGG